MKTFKRFLISALLIVLVGYVAWNHTDIGNSISRWTGNDSVMADSGTIVTKIPTVDSVIISDDTKDKKEIVIPMTTSEDNHYIVIKVNGIPMRFILDSGSNTMTIGYIEYMFLKNQELIHNPLSDSKEIILADGSKKTFRSVLIDSITIGDTTLKNVGCVITGNDSVQSGPPCLISLNTFYKFAKSITVCPADNKIILEID